MRSLMTCALYSSAPLSSGIPQGKTRPRFTNQIQAQAQNNFYATYY